MRKITDSDVSYAKRLIRMKYPYIEVTSSLYTECESAALWGLFDAARRYDPEKGVPWEAWANKRIKGEIINIVRKEINQGGVGITGKGRYNRKVSVDVSDIDPDILSKNVNPEELLACQQRLELFKQAINKLSPKAQRILYLYCVKEMTMAQIAEEVQCTIQLVSYYYVKYKSIIEKYILSKEE